MVVPLAFNNRQSYTISMLCRCHRLRWEGAAFRNCPVRPDIWKGSMVSNNFGDDSSEKILDDFSGFAAHST